MSNIEEPKRILRKKSFFENISELPHNIRKMDQFDSEHYSVLFWLIILLAFLMLVSTFVIFLANLRGHQETMVPNLKGLSLSDAIVKLQDRELYPYLAFRYTSTNDTKGLVLEESPAAGTIVKSGRMVKIVVSNGASSDLKIENYIGKKYESVKAELDAKGDTAPYTIRLPIIEVSDKAEAGTIIGQNPKAGENATNIREVEFIVSKGPVSNLIEVPDFNGLSIGEVLLQVQKSNLHVQFTMRSAQKKENPGTVISQIPEAKSKIKTGSLITINLARPIEEEGRQAGIYSKVLPKYSKMQRVELYSKNLQGETSLVFTSNSLGGKFSAPYYLPIKSSLILYVEGKETGSPYTIKRR